jgi:hypothetical protein
MLATVGGEPWGGLGKEYHFSVKSMKGVMGNTINNSWEHRCEETCDLVWIRRKGTRECLPTISMTTPMINSCMVRLVGLSSFACGG